MIPGFRSCEILVMINSWPVSRSIQINCVLPLNYVLQSRRFSREEHNQGAPCRKNNQHRNDHQINMFRRNIDGVSVMKELEKRACRYLKETSTPSSLDHNGNNQVHARHPIAWEVACIQKKFD